MLRFATFFEIVTEWRCAILRVARVLCDCHY